MPITWCIELIYMVYRGDADNLSIELIYTVYLGDADYLAYRTDLFSISG